MEELAWRLTQMLHYYDALIVQLPLDENLCQDAYSHAVLTGNPERMFVYLERLAQRFSTNHADTLRRLGATLAELGYRSDIPGLQERKNHLLTRAEETLREATAIDNSALSHMLLGKLLLSADREEEAEQELLKAQQLTPTLEQEASIEAGLGNLAMRLEQLEESIQHYRRVTMLNPDYTGAWFSLGFANRQLGHFDEAVASYQQAIQKEPGDIRAYAELTALYMNTAQQTQAQALLEQALRINPNSAYLRALFASVLFEMGDRRGAQRHLEEAEDLDPAAEFVQSVRQHIQSSKRK